MGTKKNGEPSIPKATWTLMARMHRKFADELLGIAQAAGSVGSVLLAPTIARHNGLADACEELRSEVVRGRPKELVRMVLLRSLLPTSLLPAKKLGRPSANVDELTYQVVEERRTKLTKSNEPRSTIKAAIDAINAEIARGLNLSEIRTVRSEFESVYSSYKRGKKLSLAKGQN